MKAKEYLERLQMCFNKSDIAKEVDKILSELANDISVLIVVRRA